VAGCLVVAACGDSGKQFAHRVETLLKPAGSDESTSLFPDEYRPTGPQRHTLVLPTTFGRRTGDLDQMIRRRAIRALVIINPIGFFYISGRPQGFQFEALQEFENFANQKRETGAVPFHVVFLPMRPDKLEAALTKGYGDLIAEEVVITPGRGERVAFSVPIHSHISQILVTGTALANVTSLDSLGGAPIYVNPLTTYYDNLKKLNDLRQKAGKPPLNIMSADKHLFDDDLIQMVNANLIPATVTSGNRADLWAQVLPNVRPHPEMTISDEGEVAWVMRKNTPQLKKLVDEFLQDHSEGTAFGNVLQRRYLQNVKWIRDSLAPAEMRKLIAYSEFFKRYASKYNFDYLMLAAQGFQESQLDQSKTSPAGAVGVMQVIPRVAAAPPINIPDVYDADGNIHAGAKIMHTIATTFFSDRAIDPLNKTLFTFASYNAGPYRIAHLRKKAEQDGLDPNRWFDNVELEVAQDIGEETVAYVGNIYRYYIAYTLAAKQKPRVTLPD
jgi:membrane-bound lytic murein transglycosylase MltF